MLVWLDMDSPLCNLALASLHGVALLIPAHQYAWNPALTWLRVMGFPMLMLYTRVLSTSVKCLVPTYLLAWQQGF